MRRAPRSIVVRSERGRDQFFEAVHLLRLPAQEVVEAEHFGDEAGTEPKRHRAIRGGGARGRLGDHVAFDRRQSPRRTLESLVQAVVQFVARRTAPVRLDLQRRRAGRDDDQALAVCRMIGDDRAKRVEVGNANQPRSTRRNHVRITEAAEDRAASGCRCALLRPASARRPPPTRRSTPGPCCW